MFHTAVPPHTHTHTHTHTHVYSLHYKNYCTQTMTHCCWLSIWPIVWWFFSSQNRWCCMCTCLHGTPGRLWTLSGFLLYVLLHPLWSRRRKSERVHRVSIIVSLLLQKRERERERDRQIDRQRERQRKKGEGEREQQPQRTVSQVKKTFMWGAEVTLHLTKVILPTKCDHILSQFLWALQNFLLELYSQQEDIYVALKGSTIQLKEAPLTHKIIISWPSTLWSLRLHVCQY